MDKNRLHMIDGVRGWAAFSVLLFHIFCETFTRCSSYRGFF